MLPSSVRVWHVSVLRTCMYCISVHLLRSSRVCVSVFVQRCQFVFACNMRYVCLHMICAFKMGQVAQLCACQCEPCVCTEKCFCLYISSVLCVRMWIYTSVQMKQAAGMHVWLCASQWVWEFSATICRLHFFDCSWGTLETWCNLETSKFKINKPNFQNLD